MKNGIRNKAWSVAYGTKFDQEEWEKLTPEQKAAMKTDATQNLSDVCERTRTWENMGKAGFISKIMEEDGITFEEAIS